MPVTSSSTVMVSSLLAPGEMPFVRVASALRLAGPVTVTLGTVEVVGHTGPLGGPRVGRWVGGRGDPVGVKTSSSLPDCADGMTPLKSQADTHEGARPSHSALSTQHSALTCVAEGKPQVVGTGVGACAVGHERHRGGRAEARSGLRLERGGGLLGCGGIFLQAKLPFVVV